MPEAKHIVLVGLMGAGKSTVGRRLADALRRPFVDNDDMLQRRTGRTARDIAARDGLGALHRAETDVLQEALSSPEPAVIAASAAAAVDPRAVPALARSYVVYLRAQPDVLAARVHRPSDDAHRPVTDLAEQYAERDSVYRARASFTVDASSRSVEEVVQKITDALAREGNRT
jgi:shikimate kinase